MRHQVNARIRPGRQQHPGSVRAPRIRELGLENLDALGYELDRQKNDKAIGAEAEISKASSRVKIFVIPTNEELLIARDTYRAIEGIENP